MSFVEAPTALGDLSGAIFGAYNKPSAAPQPKPVEPILSEEERARLARTAGPTADVSSASMASEGAFSTPNDSRVTASADSSLNPALLESDAAARYHLTQGLMLMLSLGSRNKSN